MTFPTFLFSLLASRPSPRLFTRCWSWQCMITWPFPVLEWNGKRVTVQRYVVFKVYNVLTSNSKSQGLVIFYQRTATCNALKVLENHTCDKKKILLFTICTEKPARQRFVQMVSKNPRLLTDSVRISHLPFTLKAPIYRKILVRVRTDYNSKVAVKNCDILKFSVTVRLRGHKQKK